MSWAVRAVQLPDGDRPAELWVDAAGCLVTEPVPGAERLPGRYVAPGLVDAHAHPAVGRGAGMPMAPAGRYFPALLPEAAPQEQLAELAVGELARGGRWVKVIADFPPVTDGMPSGPPELTYSGEAIKAMVAAVHAAGGRVAAHVTTDAVSDLVRAGVDSIEHGTAMDESALRLMAQTGAAWTPTLCAVTGLPDTAPEAARRRVAEYRQRLPELLPLAQRLGVPILAGTDTAGTIAGEVALLARVSNDHGLVSPAL